MAPCVCKAAISNAVVYFSCEIFSTCVNWKVKLFYLIKSFSLSLRSLQKGSWHHSSGNVASGNVYIYMLRELNM